MLMGFLVGSCVFFCRILRKYIYTHLSKYIYLLICIYVLFGRILSIYFLVCIFWLDPEYIGF